MSTGRLSRRVLVGTLKSGNKRAQSCLFKGEAGTSTYEPYNYAMVRIGRAKYGMKPIRLNRQRVWRHGWDGGRLSKQVWQTRSRYRACLPRCCCLCLSWSSTDGLVFCAQVRRYCFACCYQSEQGERGPWVFLNSEHGVDGETDGHSTFNIQAPSFKDEVISVMANSGRLQRRCAARDARKGEKEKEVRRPL